MLAKKLAIALSFASICVGSANAAEPLKLEGKTSIYQRVLTTPSCKLKSSATATDGKKIDVFSRFYVYSDDGKNVEVGPDTTGKIAGFLDKDCTVDWKMQTALMFTNPANRNRALIFKTKEDLQNIIDSSEPKTEVEPIMKKLASSQAIDGVISAEPEHFVDYKKKFYLLPILDFEESMFNDGSNVQEINIATVTKQDPNAKKTDASNELKTFKAAVVFVIDSSISMQQYIDRTKQTINAITKEIKDQKLSNNVHFGLVSFRSNTKAVPGLEYTSKVYVKPGEATDESEFKVKLDTLNQAKVSSKYFDEDSFAGVNSALEKINWADYGGRYIVLITDAGGISGNDPLSTTGLDSKELRLEAQHKGVAIYAMHLLTESGKKTNNHAKAKSQYTDLTFNSTVNKSLYYPVNAGDVNSFGKKIDDLSSAITKQVKLAAFGKEAVGAQPNTPNKKSEDSLDEDTIALGHAMQLAYLGSKLGTSVPDFIKGWISDRDLVNHGVPTSTPVVLLTKNELSSLKDVTKGILNAANDGMLQPEDMFNQLRSIASSLGRDPSSISQDKTKKLGQMGLLGEYLDDLPYKSRIQELDEDTWSSMGPDEQNQVIADLENKLNYYQQFNDDAARWIKLNKDEDASESVYPVPLEVLP